MRAVKDRDMELWERWKKSQNPADLQQLLNQLYPIINREVSKWAPAMSRSLLEAEAKRLTVEAFKTYDPNRGTALSTHVASRLPKLSRMVYSTQNVARMSETKTLQFHTYTNAVTDLKDQLGREPTVIELSDRLAWSPRQLKQFQSEANRKEFIESEEHPDFAPEDDHLIDFIYHDLTPVQQKIFEFSTGYRGAPKLSGKQIMQRLALTQGMLSYQKSLIVKAVERARGR